MLLQPAWLANWSVQFEVAVLRLAPAAGRAIMWLATVLTPLSTTENTCLSIQSLVLVTTFRCHFFVSHSAYPTFWGLHTYTRNSTRYQTWVFCCLLFTVDLIMYLGVMTSTLLNVNQHYLQEWPVCFTSYAMHKPAAIQLMPATNQFKPVSHPSSYTLLTTDHLGTMQEHYKPCIRCIHCTPPYFQQAVKTLYLYNCG